MGESPSGTPDMSRRFCTPIASTASACTPTELRTFSSPSKLDSLLYYRRPRSRIRCTFSSATQLRSTSHPLNFLCSGRSMQELATEMVPAQASTTKFPGLVSFCAMSPLQTVFFCSGHIKSLNLDFLICLEDELIFQKPGIVGRRMGLRRMRHAYLFRRVVV